MPRPPRAEYSTAERAFARSSIKTPSAKNLFFAEYLKSILGSANHSAVHVSMGEADELADLIFAAFAVKSPPPQPRIQTQIPARLPDGDECACHAVALAKADTRRITQQK